MLFYCHNNISSYYIRTARATLCYTDSNKSLKCETIWNDMKRCDGRKSRQYDNSNIDTVTPLLHHGYAMIIPRLCHGYTTVTPRLCYDYTTVTLWLIMLWLYHCSTTVMLWLYHGYATVNYAMIIPLLHHGYATIIPRLHHGYAMVVPRRCGTFRMRHENADEKGVSQSGSWHCVPRQWNMEIERGEAGDRERGGQKILIE